MSDSLTNLLRAYGNWSPALHIPLLSPQAQQKAPQGPLPGQGVFASLTPEQQFWFHLLMGAGVGQPIPPSAINPYYAMNLLQGPQGAVYPPQEEQG